jgi:hypothetical protein
MDDTDRVLARLRRIEALQADVPGDGAVAASRRPELLAELRALVPEAEAWARLEGDARARSAAAKLREEAEGMQ